MKRVFCIGNGESRKGFDLETLRQHGTIYGCNAIYRDFMPDVLTAVDHGIMHEIYHAGVAQKIPCYFRDWTKVPAMTYESMLYGAMDKTEADKTLDKVLKSNDRGDSKDLGYNLEFRSQIEFSYKLKSSRIGFNLNHISNASIGDTNPGTESATLSIIRPF